METKLHNAIGAIEARLADWAWRLSRRDEGIFTELLATGLLRDPHTDDRQLTVTGVTGIRVGLPLGLDPLTSAAQVGLAFAGELWPLAYPGLLKAINQRWGAAVKQRTGR